MRVLMVNKFHYVKGGSETYCFALKRLLQERGHTVIDFCMADERNLPSPYSAYFVSNQDYHSAGGVFQQAKAACKFVYSLEAKRKFERLIRDAKPDLVHLHLFHHQISPSILDVVRKYHLPTVYTAHDLQLLCPDYKMLRHGTPCEACLNGQVFSCVRNRCVMDSFGKSVLSALENKLHRARGVYDVLQTVITPSAFYRDLFLRAGYAPERVVHLPNFWHEPEISPNRNTEEAPYILFTGRLTEEKGLRTLLRAVEGTDIPLRIAGTGPMEEELRRHIRERSMENVRLLGFLRGEALYREISGARAIVLPSEWYENGPYSAIEGLCFGRPIVGSRIGGIPELIGDNGMLTEPGNAAALRQALQTMLHMPKDQWEAMSQASRRLFEARHTAKVYAERLGEVYGKLGVKR